MNRLSGDEFTNYFMNELCNTCKMFNISKDRLITASIDAVIMVYRDNPTESSSIVGDIMGLHNGGVGVLMVATKRVLHCIDDPKPLESRDDWISRIYNRYLENTTHVRRGAGPGPVSKQVSRQVISMCADNYFN